MFDVVLQRWNDWKTTTGPIRAAALSNNDGQAIALLAARHKSRDQDVAGTLDAEVTYNVTQAKASMASSEAHTPHPYATISLWGRSKSGFMPFWILGAADQALKRKLSSSASRSIGGRSWLPSDAGTWQPWPRRRQKSNSASTVSTRRLKRASGEIIFIALRRGPKSTTVLSRSEAPQKEF